MALYGTFTADEYTYISNLRDKFVSASIHSREASIMSRDVTNWMAIFYPYFKNRDTEIRFNSEYYYYKSTDLENAYPTNPNERNLLRPFNTLPNAIIKEITFVGTTTGTKIYDYADALVEKAGYQNFKSAAMVLTQSRTHKVKVIKTENRVFILTNSINEELVRKATTLYPVLFDETELLNDAVIKECCKRVAEKEDIRDLFENIFKERESEKANALENYLTDMLKKSKHKRIDDLINEQNRTESNIRDYENNLAALFDKLDRVQSDLLGAYEAYNKLTFDFSDIKEYVKRNQYIKSIEISTRGYGRENLLLNIIAPITIYDPNALNRQIENLKYYLGQSAHKFLDVLKRIFVDGEFTLYCQTYCLLDLKNNEIEANKDNLRFNYSDYKCMIQPHLALYNCWGDQRYAIRKALREGDYIGAFQLVTTQVQNINFTDTTVVKNWISRMCDNHSLRQMKTCLSRADGQWWSIEDIIEQLLREQMAAEEQKAKAQEIINTTTEEEVGHPELVDELPQF